MERWVVAAKKAEFKKVGRDFHIDPVIARLIRNRDVIGYENIDEYLNGDLNYLHDPKDFKDMKKALDILDSVINAKKKIRIIGDYDIDGVMSTYILLTGLKKVGARADIQIPDRIKDGYGLNESLVREACDAGVDLILTCDNGIAASEQVKVAKDLGMQVIVTDHHEVPYEDENGRRNYLLPPADAIVNPKQQDCHYPFKGLCGAAVAWKLICALYQRHGIDRAESIEFIEYAAFATIGDVMDLQGENRVIVKEGLKRLRKTKSKGLLALMGENQLHSKDVNAYHIGFVLGPCLNASGRLDTAKRALAMLCAKSNKEAAELAGDLKALNESRKAMTLQGTKEAISYVEQSDLQKDRVLVVYLPECHESLAGIIAGRLREHYHKPSFVITKTTEGLKGSGRSIESYSMYDELCKCKELLTKFGGHPMAAGLSLDMENLSLFRKKINEVCTLDETDLMEKVVIDIEMPIAYISKKLVSQIELLAPFGKGNSKPLFAQKGLKVTGVRIFGKNKNVAKMQVIDTNGYVMDAVFFGEAEEFAEYVKTHGLMALTYYPTINQFRGRESLQITVINYQ
ncbi:single-stranded-DNA-specific exonuclease RecJ [Blautia liquoris]|uniref:Single-stranded-DNA-specific exonuclease RecJ n=1 Tax=Blautia liquoris TaxID=2779518 RepID=A0A7M2RKN9_9FIRM|nr:single-stranded-DNA-specific exonuclease RecJ [Blautia liquoris]QOV20849.1 single-stranded-DNA-specific exonuclease RecJ [Blautia liquoris]